MKNRLISPLLFISGIPALIGFMLVWGVQYVVVYPLRMLMWRYTHIDSLAKVSAADTLVKDIASLQVIFQYIRDQYVYEGRSIEHTLMRIKTMYVCFVKSSVADPDMVLAKMLDEEWRTFDVEVEFLLSLFSFDYMKYAPMRTTYHDMLTAARAHYLSELDNPHKE